jgi:hypothetical protein
MSLSKTPLSFERIFPFHDYSLLGGNHISLSRETIILFVLVLSTKDEGGEIRERVIQTPIDDIHNLRSLLSSFSNDDDNSSRSRMFLYSISPHLVLWKNVIC